MSLQFKENQRTLCLILSGENLEDSKLLNYATRMPGLFRLIVIGEKSNIFDPFDPVKGGINRFDGPIEFYPAGTDIPLPTELQKHDVIVIGKNSKN